MSWWCSSPAKVASGEWRSRTAATVAGAPGLQRADAAPELVARTLGPRWCSTERSLLSGLRRGERMEEIGRGRTGEEEWKAGRRRTWRGGGSVVEAGEPSCEELGVYVGDDKGEREATSAFDWGGGKGQAHDETRPG